VEERVTAEELEPLARQHAALRRVATFVARQPPPTEVFDVVTREAGIALGARLTGLLRVESPEWAAIVASWSSGGDALPVGSRGPLDGRGLVGRILRTGRPVRLDDFDEVGGAVAAQMRHLGVRSAVAGPIVLGGRTWGALSATWSEGVPIPQGAEDRVAEFAELVAYAIDNAETREDLRRLADEQAALRRVATLVAQGSPPAEVFTAVAKEVAELAKAQMVLMSRYEPDGTATVIGAWGDHPLRAGARWTLDGPSISATVLQTGETARLDEAPEGPGVIADVARELGVHSRVGVPIIVDGGLWGVIAAGASGRQSLPPDVDARVAKFTELVATAISNSQAREDLQRLADEQAALRRIATLVAQGSEAGAVFDAVCEETGRLFAATSVNLAHFTAEGFNSGFALFG
jgi:GAF domain-containing protein